MMVYEIHSVDKDGDPEYLFYDTTKWLISEFIDFNFVLYRTMGLQPMYIFLIMEDQIGVKEKMTWLKLAKPSIGVGNHASFSHFTLKEFAMTPADFFKEHELVENYDI